LIVEVTALGLCFFAEYFGQILLCAFEQDFHTRSLIHEGFKLNGWDIDGIYIEY
jgi:uncharacterized membrane protein (DUF485 family)